MRLWCCLVLAGGLIAGCDADEGVSEPVGFDSGMRNAGMMDAGGTVPDLGSRDMRLGGDSALDAGASDASQTDALVMPPRPDADSEPQAGNPIRNPCFEGEPIEAVPALPPESCEALFQARPELGTGCYFLSDGAGGGVASQCYRHKALVVLVNNEIESDFHPLDVDEDGVIDEGPLAGTNHPADPFDIPHDEFVSRLRSGVADWYTEVTYGSVYLDLESIYRAPSVDGLPDRWFRLLALRPTFLHPEIFRQVCEMRGGMSLDDWQAYHFIVTIISHGTSTSGSQWRLENIPTGPECDVLLPFTRNYIVMKNFRGWSRLGTLLHELGHGMNRAPAPAGLGHSEATHAETGEQAEYGDHSDVMGRSSNRGHFSVAQKAFLRVLPARLIEQISLQTREAERIIHPLERNRDETKGVRVEVAEGRSYYVEARRSLGSDDGIPAVLHRGVLLKRANEIQTASKSWFIDATPETPTANSGDGVLFPGRTYSDPENGIHISLVPSEADGSLIAVKRNEVIGQTPTIEALNAMLVDDDLVAEVEAIPGDASIAEEQLLYFWKVGALNERYGPNGGHAGRAIRITDFDPTDEVWLFISDRQGGELIQQVWPPQ